MKFRLNILILIFAAAVPTVFGQQFRYRNDVGDKFSIVTTVVQDVYKNGSFSHTASSLNRSSHAVLQKVDDRFIYRSRYYLSEKKSTVDHSYRLEKTYDSIYTRDIYGRFIDSEMFFMPVVRNIPVFPEKAIYPGDKWIGKGIEIHDFREDFHIKKPYDVPAAVMYEYVQDTVVDGINVAEFKIKYSLYKAAGATPVGPLQYPSTVFGTSELTLFWNKSIGAPYLITEDFKYNIGLSDGQTLEYRGKSRSEFRDDGRIDLTSLIALLIKALKENGFDNPKVERSPDGDGITIILEGIGFNANSADLRPDERRLLTNLSNVLKEFPGFDLLITGHTALADTEAERMTLSKARAAVTAEFLIAEGARKDYQVMTDGKGAKEPRADNSTAEGMAKNRRVEIKLLTNFGETVDVELLKKKLEEGQYYID